MIKIQASVSKGWLHDNGGFTFPRQYYLDPLFRLEQDRKINEFVAAKFPGLPVYSMEDNLVQAEHVNDRQVVVGAIQPNMILAAMLGAEFSPFEDKDADVSGYPLEGIEDAGRLPAIDSLLDFPFIKELDAQVEKVRREHPQLEIIPPFFWDASGRATIHGIITTSLKLIGENIMILMLANPEFVHAVHQWITDAYITVIRHYSSMCGLPVTSVHVGECSGPMLSGELYAEFVVPYLDQLGEKLGPIRIHSCGKSDHLVEAVARIKNLGIIDTGSNTSLKKIRDMVGQEVEINTFPPMDILLKGSPREKVEEWVETILAENNGGDLKIAYHLESDYDPENCMMIHKMLEKKGLCKPERLY